MLWSRMYQKVSLSHPKTMWNITESHKVLYVEEPPARQAWREGEAMARQAVTRGHMLLTEDVCDLGASRGCRKSTGAKQHRAPNLRLPCADRQISSFQARLLLETSAVEQLPGQFPSLPQLSSVKSLSRMCEGWIYHHTTQVSITMVLLGPCSPQTT